MTTPMTTVQFRQMSDGTKAEYEMLHDLEREYSGGGFGIQQAYVIRKP